MNGKTRILLTGGGSGGHVYPLLAVADSLQKIARENDLDVELNYVGPKDAFSPLLENASIKLNFIPAGKIRRYLSPLLLLDIPKFFFGVFAALFRLYLIMPDAIFSKGGTGSLPVVLAGWFYRIPVIIHESDAAPGLNNLLSAYFSSKIALSFERAMKYFNPKKTALVGTPIRNYLTEKTLQEGAKESLGFNPNETLALILGGSQGSDRINKFVVTNLEEFVKETQILHQTGQSNYQEIKKLSEAALSQVPLMTEINRRYQVVPYLEDNLKTAMSAADLIIARAGSGTIAEISAFGKPAILIPLHEAANNHQRINAQEFARTGAAVVIEEPNLLSAIFLKQVKTILEDDRLRAKMAAASQNFFKPQAAEIIARELIELAS